MDEDGSISSVIPIARATETTCNAQLVKVQNERAESESNLVHDTFHHGAIHLPCLLLIDLE
jgi:hypothetical protein